MAVALAARVANIVDGQLALAHIIAGLGGNRATLSALVVKQALDLVVGILRASRSTILVEGADAAL